ncbi:MAG: Ada metal-binding domain-containing protein [Sediminicola sp.]|tara:strand:- start:166530 stop:166775 length:246 start_codon:yes stop_codon:yes gene_type:complete
MVHHEELEPHILKGKIKHGELNWGGNHKLKIYGTLRCKSGKKMKPENRVFFQSEMEAREQGYRPCGHCMVATYKKWKNGSF